jgi:hypothetical protein
MTIFQDKTPTADVLEAAEREGEVRVKRADGREFAVKPIRNASPLDVAGVPTDLTRTEIVDLVRQGRERNS